MHVKQGQIKISNVSGGDLYSSDFLLCKGSHILKSRMHVESFLMIHGD
jgi:hypothetical protein